MDREWEISIVNTEIDDCIKGLSVDIVDVERHVEVRDWDRCVIEVENMEKKISEIKGYINSLRELHCE